MISLFSVFDTDDNDTLIAAFSLDMEQIASIFAKASENSYAATIIPHY